MALKVLVSRMSAPASRYCGVDLADDLRLGQHQQVVVALEVAARQSAKRCAAVIGLAQLVALDHGAHGAVQDQDALLQLLVEQGGAFGTCS